MNIAPINNTPSFEGSIILRRYSATGKESIKHYLTTPAQDRLIQVTASTMTPNGFISHPLNIQDAVAFKCLLEMIIKKPIKETGQRKLMTNMGETCVNFGDSQPGKGGFFAICDFKV